MVQIFVKVDGGKPSVMEMEMSDKVDDIVKKIVISDQNVYVTSGGSLLRGTDKMKNCGVRDGSAVQVYEHAMRGAENTRTRRVKRRRRSKSRN